MSLFEILAGTLVLIVLGAAIVFLSVAIIFPKKVVEDDNTPHGDTTGWNRE